VKFLALDYTFLAALCIDLALTWRAEALLRLLVEDTTDRSVGRWTGRLGYLVELTRGWDPETVKKYLKELDDKNAVYVESWFRAGNSPEASLLILNYRQIDHNAGQGSFDARKIPESTRIPQFPESTTSDVAESPNRIPQFPESSREGTPPQLTTKPVITGFANGDDETDAIAFAKSSLARLKKDGKWRGTTESSEEHYIEIVAAKWKPKPAKAPKPAVVHDEECGFEQGWGCAPPCSAFFKASS